MGTVLDTRLFAKNRDGLFVEYKEPYASIECETEGDFKQVQEAMEKQTAKAPVLKMHVKGLRAIDYVDGTGELQETDDNFWVCPCCDAAVGQRKIIHDHIIDQCMKKYCENCGQKINWTKEAG